jgi:hypothetical protein
VKPIVQVTSGRWKGRKGVLAGIDAVPVQKGFEGGRKAAVFIVDLWEHSRSKARQVRVSGVQSADDNRPPPCPKCGASNLAPGAVCKTPSGRDHVERRMVVQQWGLRQGG